MIKQGNYYLEHTNNMNMKKIIEIPNFLMGKGYLSQFLAKENQSFNKIYHLCPKSLLITGMEIKTKKSITFDPSDPIVLSEK